MMSNRDYGISRRVHVIKRDYAKSKVDHSCPTTYMHMYIKLKRLQRIEEDQLRITHQNRVLSERILKSMAMPSQVDNHLADDIPDFHSMKFNLLKRQRHLMAQTLQNQSLLKKISCVKSEYRREPMFKEYQKMKAIMSRRNRKTTGSAERNYYKQKNEDNKVLARSRLYLAPGSQRKKKQHVPTVAKIDEEAPGPSAFGIVDSNEEFVPCKNELPTIDKRKGRDRQSPLPALVNKSGHSQPDESFSRTTTGYETVDGVESYDEVKDMLQKGLGSSVVSGRSEKQTRIKPWMDATSDREDESKDAEESSLPQPSAKTLQLQQVVEPVVEPIDLTPLDPWDESSIQRKKRGKRPARPVPKPAANALTSGGGDRDLALNYAGQNVNQDQSYGDMWAEKNNSKNDPDWVDEELPAKEFWTPPARSFLRSGVTKKRVSLRSPASVKPLPGKAAPKVETKKTPVETPKAKPANILDETSIQKNRRAERNKEKDAPAVMEKIEQRVEKEEEVNYEDEQWEDVPSGVVEHYKNDEFNWPDTDSRAPVQFRPSSRQIQLEGSGARRGSRPMPNGSKALDMARARLLKKLEQERVEPEHAITNRFVASVQETEKKQQEEQKKGPVGPPAKKYEWGTFGQLREANFARVDEKRRAEARARAELELKKRKEAERAARKAAAEKKKRKALRAAREAERRRQKDEEARLAREELRRRQKRVARKYYYQSDSSSSGESSSSEEDEKKQEDQESVMPERRYSEESGSSSESDSSSD